MDAMVKNIVFLTKNQTVKVKIIAELRNDEHGRRELSIVGEINTHTFGQCDASIRELVEQHGSGHRDKGEILKLLDIWDRWHLNTMRAGTPRQQEILRPWLKRNPNKDYTEQCDYLFSHGLLVDDGYKYGTAWLYDPLPDDVITFISGL
jgi:hypothetical protein